MCFLNSNVICIQTNLSQLDYQTEESFYRVIRSYLINLRDNGHFRVGTVVCFPEYIGTWLVFLNESRFVFSAKSLSSAIRRVAIRNIFPLLSIQFREKFKNCFSDSFFRLKSSTILNVYQNTFSELAKEFGITIVAGSVVLPAPSLQHRKLSIDKSGPLLNVSCSWNSAGEIINVTIKVSPTAAELKFTKGGQLTDLKATETSAGRLGIIICGDGWDQQTYEHYHQQQVDAFIVLAYVPSDVEWHGPWKGYSGKQVAPDVTLSDIGKISEYEAWKKYCVSRAKRYDKPTIVFFNRSQLWNFGSHGHPFVLDKGEIIECPTELNGAAIISRI